MFLVYVGFELKTKKKIEKKNVMNIFIDYYHQILTFFSRVGSVIFQEMAGVRGGCPILFFFFFYNLISNSSKETHQKQVELKVRTILQISSISTPYISAVSPIFVVLEPNLQDMLTTVQGACTLHFVCFFFFATILGPDYMVSFTLG